MQLSTRKALHHVGHVGHVGLLGKIKSLTPRKARGHVGFLGKPDTIRQMRKIVLLAVIALAVAPVFAAATLKFDVPTGWISKTPTSSMRIAELTVPRAAGDAEDGSVTVFFFGATQGGNAQANIDRWIGQMAQPDGQPSSTVAKTSASETASGLKLSIVDVSGTYVAEVSPGSAEHLNKPGFRQIAVYVATPGGPYFVKCVGPAATVAKWHDSLQAFLRSIKYE